jgi:hypothetical protein
LTTILNTTINEYRALYPKTKVCSLNKEGLVALQIATDNAFKSLIDIIPSNFNDQITCKLLRHAWSIFTLCKSVYKYPLNKDLLTVEHAYGIQTQRKKFAQSKLIGEPTQMKLTRTLVTKIYTMRLYKS